MNIIATRGGLPRKQLELLNIIGFAGVAEKVIASKHRLKKL
jgi:hypothetical protein